MFGGDIGIALLTAISDGSTYSTQVIATAGQGIGANSIAVRFRSGDLTATGDAALATVSPP